VPGEKTEQPTSKRVREARKKGQVFKSQDITQAILFLTAAGIVVSGSGIFVDGLRDLLRSYLNPQLIASSLEPAVLLKLTSSAFERFLVLVAPMSMAARSVSTRRLRSRRALPIAIAPHTTRVART